MEEHALLPPTAQALERRRMGSPPADRPPCRRAGRPPSSCLPGRLPGRRAIADTVPTAVGPEEIFDTLASAARLADIEAAVRLMQVIGRNGPRASSFVRDAEAGQWTMVMRMRQDRDRNGFTLTGQMLTLGVRSMLYEIMEQPGPLTDPAGTPTNIPLRPVLGTEVWATISPWMWAMS